MTLEDKMKAVRGLLKNCYQDIWAKQNALYEAASKNEPTEDLSIELFNSVSEFERVSKDIIGQ